MFVCKKCGEESPVWNRSCPVCSAEMSLKKKVLLPDIDKRESLTGSEPEHLPSGFPVFDRTFNGGFLVPFLYFIHARESTGKTSFLLHVCAHMVSIGKSVVFFAFDDGLEGITKKCTQFRLNDHLPCFVYENSPGIVERTIAERKPDFVVIDSLQSLSKYNSDEIVGTLYRIRMEAQKRRFALVIIGEERKDSTSYLGSASIGHIADVPVSMTSGLDEELVISTPNKNRDTDDKTSRCFFRKTMSGLLEIAESETGFLPRHKENTVIGFAAFVARNGNDFLVDEITAAVDAHCRKPTLTITGMNSAKAKSLLTVLEANFLLVKTGFVLRANITEKNISDAELASLIAILSLIYKKPIPVDTVFIGSIDNRGYLLPVEGMERRVKRAQALGYRRIIGPKANGIQSAVWEEAETVQGVWKALDFAE